MKIYIRGGTKPKCVELAEFLNRHGHDVVSTWHNEEYTSPKTASSVQEWNKFYEDVCRRVDQMDSADAFLFVDGNEVGKEWTQYLKNSSTKKVLELNGMSFDELLTVINQY